jgi:hypothetical protein
LPQRPFRDVAGKKILKMKKILFYLLILFFSLFVFIFIKSLYNFSTQFNEFKKNALGYNAITPVEYFDVIRYIFKDTLGRKKTFLDKNRNPIVMFKNVDSQFVFVHKLNVSNFFSLDSVIVENVTKDIATDELYDYLIYDTYLPVQVKLDSKIKALENRVFINLSGQLIDKVEKTDSLIKIKASFSNLSIRYNELNIPDIYMTIDNGNSIKKFDMQKGELMLLKSRFGFFIVFINTSP